MTEEKSKEKTESKKEEKMEEKKTEEKLEDIAGKKTEEKSESLKKEDKKEEKSEDKKEKKKKDEKPKVKKYEAVALGRSLPISKKHSMYICSFIKHKEIDTAIKDLSQVISYKRAIPFKGEIPHRKGKGMMSGRYPIKASKYFINLLKALKGNAIVNGLELERTRIKIATASGASRPARSGGRRAKRTHVTLKAAEISGGKK